jgi:hypothetical protein
LTVELASEPQFVFKEINHESAKERKHEKRREMKDGKVLNADPEGIMGYTSVPFRDWFNDLPYA